MSTLDISVGVPSAGRVPISFAYSLAGMVASVAAGGLKTVADAEIKLTLDIVESSNWITNREQLARRALDSGRTHLMFLDDDMTFDPRVLAILAGRRHDIVVSNYLIKSDKPEFVAVGLDGRRVSTTRDSTGILPIAYSGFGVSLISTEVFKRTPQPWFMPEFNPQKSEYTTEDNPFFRRARESGFTVYLDHDASKMIGHVGQRTWYWNEVTETNHG